METQRAQLSADQEAKTFSSGTKLTALAVSNAAVVAVLYLNQTILGQVALSFPTSNLVSLLPSMTLAGYASGVALVAFSPVARARLSVERHLGCLALALLMASLASSVLTLATANFFVGCAAAVAPRLLAGAAHLAAPAKAGAAIGRVVCGSLAAILCVRLFGGALATVLGWRCLFMIAAAIMASSAVLVQFTRAMLVADLHGITPPSSLAKLWQSHLLLRRAAIQQCTLFAAYNASWMSVLTELPPNERPLVVIGGSCAGILAALLAGWLSDKPCQSRVAQAGATAVFLAGTLVLPVAYGSEHGPLQVLLLLVGMALVDAGLQIALVANQKRVQALEANSRTRLAASLTVCGFLGGAIGAGAGHVLWQTSGWQAAIAFVAIAGCIGLASSLLPTWQQAATPARLSSPHARGLKRGAA